MIKQILRKTNLIKANFWLLSACIAIPLLSTTQAAQLSLRDAYKGRFMIGVGADGLIPGDYNDKELDIIRTQFDILTPANCMKMYHIEPQKGLSNFQQADAFLAFAESNSQQVCGHCLIWAKDERTPSWFFKNSDKKLTRDQLLKRMKNYINKVAGRYKGRIIYWDVVNEALADGEEFFRPSSYLEIIGDDFITKAFEYARTAAPNAVLIYNDYNIFQPHKRKKLERLLKLLKDQNAPIDAIGLQGHFELDDVPYEDVEETIKIIKSFGLKVMVSELDIDVVKRSKWWAEGGKYRDELAKYDPYAPTCPPEILKRQADQYARLFALFNKYSDSIGRISFWNVHDGRSWLNNFPWKRVNHPLLFDRNAKPKPAFKAVIDAAAESSQLRVTSPPAEVVEQLNLDPFYKKYVNLRGFSIVSSEKVSDYALLEAAYLIDKLLSDRQDILDALTSNKVRLAVMSYNELTTDIPEHSDLNPGKFWDRRARGLGPTRSRPAVSCAEENLLCYPGDPYGTENILIHEFAHAMHHMGLNYIDETFDKRLKSAYESAMEKGLWKDKYAANNRAEYWAEAVQSFFNDNREPDHDHNHVNTRAELFEYDPDLAKIVQEVFGDKDWEYKKPARRNAQERKHLTGYDAKNAPSFAWPTELLKWYKNYEAEKLKG